MRYTTIIDISDMPIYKCQGVRLAYLHLVLKAGWTTEDADKAAASVRRLAADAGLTVAAARHALRQLQKAGLIEKEAGGKWKVKKWIAPPVPAERPRGRQPQAHQEADAERMKLWEEFCRLRAWSAEAKERKDDEQLRMLSEAMADARFDEFRKKRGR